MKTQILTILFFFIAIVSYSQQLEYKSRGRILQNGQVLAPSEVRTLLATKPGLLNFYDQGRNKKTIGNVLIVGGMSLLAADLMVGLSSATTYPTALTYAGAAAIIIAIPVKIGFSKKIKTVVNDYNKEIAGTDSKLKIDNISFIANQHGAGLQITF